MRRKDDILWKGILEDIFDDFLCFLNPEASEVFDFDKGFEFLDKSWNKSSRLKTTSIRQR